jgi:CRP-like cAMP-binding protein
MSETVIDRAAILRRAPWVAALGDEAIGEVLAAGQVVRFVAGRTIIRELEVGESLYVILAGQAQATVAAGQTRALELGVLSVGDGFGELALLTRELRSATVTAITEVEALRLGRFEFEAILRRHPQVAVHFAKEIGARLVETDAALDALLVSAEASQRHAPAGRLLGVTPSVRTERGSLRRAFFELVLSHKGELPFMAMSAFVGALLAIRLAVRALELLGGDLFELLRGAYTSGIALLVVSVAASLLSFSPRTRRAIALGYGIGFALIVNELPVFLAFDTFYLDMTTRDPELEFSVAALYRRTEGEWASALLFAILAQATYLRRFYRRIGFIFSNRLRALLARTPDA